MAQLAAAFRNWGRYFLCKEISGSEKEISPENPRRDFFLGASGAAAFVGLGAAGLAGPGFVTGAGFASVFWAGTAFVCLAGSGFVTNAGFAGVGFAGLAAGTLLGFGLALDALAGGFFPS